MLLPEIRGITSSMPVPINLADVDASGSNLVDCDEAVHDPNTEAKRTKVPAVHRPLERRTHRHLVMPLPYVAALRRSLKARKSSRMFHKESFIIISKSYK